MIISNVAPVLNQPQRVFPLAHSWDSAFTASYEFKTDLLRSHTGKEQRKAVRFNPRRSFQYSLTYMRDQKYFLDQFFDTDARKLAWMPEENCTTRTVEAMGEDDPAVRVRNTNKPWMKPGVTVILQWKGRAETRKIASVGSSILTFSEFNKTTWPVGTRVTKAVLCRVQQDAESSRLTSSAGTMGIQAVADPENDLYSPGDFEQSFLGFREYFQYPPDWANSPSITHQYPRDDIDYGFGSISSFVSEKFPQRLTKIDVWRGSAAASFGVIDFFCRHWGMQREFFFPAIEKMIPYAATAGKTKAIIVDGLNFGEVYAASTVYKRVMFKRKDGTEIHRQIDFIEVLPDTNSTVIWVTEELPDEPLSPADTLGLFWVTVARFATDRLDVQWLTDEVARFSLITKNLENPDL